LKNPHPIIEKIRRMSPPIMTTLETAPKMEKRELTTILRFGNLLMTLKGLSARKALKAFRNAISVSIYSIYMTRSKTEMQTTKKSILFQPDPK
jgi:hypothetical protein